jgi:ACS family hexuronate transporter-like MFS transporter
MTRIASQNVELIPLDQYIGIPVSHPARGGGFGVALLIPTILAISTCSLSSSPLPLSLMHLSPQSPTCYLRTFTKNESVATVSGLSGTGPPSARSSFLNWRAIFPMRVLRGGTHLFDPLMVIAGRIPFVGMILVLMLVRNTKATDQGLVRRI